MSFDGMRRPSFSQANVQIAGASELMSPASEPNTLVVPVCALVPTPDGGHGMYVSVSGASPFLFIPVTLVERGAALEGAPVRDDGEEVARVTHSGQVPPRGSRRRPNSLACRCCCPASLSTASRAN